jgi:hypothetical protein
MSLMGFLWLVCSMGLIDEGCSYSLLPQHILLPHETCSLPIPIKPFPSSLLANWKSAVQSGIVMTMIATSCLLSTPAIASSAEPNTHEWELMNGSVVLKDPIVFQESVRQGESGKASTVSCTLTKPKLIGAGGGGAVFAFENSLKLLKVSWEGSSKSVERECSTLQLLERNKVESSERCLGKYDYKSDDDYGENSSRVMILVEPYVPDGVATVMEVNEPKRDVAVEQIARTLVQMLAANIVTIDVQPLVSKETGRVIFIDMTEAQELKPPFTFLAKTLMSSFTTEMMALIPEPFMSTAVNAAMQEIENLEARGVVLSPEAMDVLRDQTSFIPL